MPELPTPVLAYALDETSGASAIDSSLNGNTGTIIGTPTKTTNAKYGRGLQFDGVALSCVQFPLLGIFAPGSTRRYTVSLWLIGATGCFDGASVRTICSPAGDDTIFFEYKGGTGIWAGWYDGTLHGSIFANPVENTWYHLAWVFDPPNNTLYVNGVPQTPVATGTSQAGSGSVDMNTFGAWRQAPASALLRMWNGTFDNIRIYATALNDMQVALDMATPIIGGAVNRPLWPTESPTLLQSPALPRAVLAYAFDEGSGTSAADSSGYNRTGTLAGSPAWNNTGKYGKALDFDGVNDVVVFPPLGIFGGAVSWTMTCWVNGTGNVYSQGHLTIIHPRGEFDVSLEFNAGVFSAAWFDGTNHPCNGAFTPVAGTWYHLAAVWNKSENTLTLYIDGAPRPSIAIGTPNVVTGDNTIGARRLTSGGAADQVWLGTIDNARIYNVALTAAEVSLDANTPFIGVRNLPVDVSTHPKLMLRGDR